MELNPYISVVIPSYRGSESLNELCSRLDNVLESINSNYEIILVNDGSPTDDWSIISSIANNNTKVKGINLSRNFGQHYAITAGLEHAKGEWVVVMDCDLQDRPEEIKRFYEKASEGFDVVLGRRFERQDNWVKRTLSHAFYKVLSYLTNTTQDSTIANYGIYNKKVIKAICSMGDNLRYFPTMVKWVGFRQTTIDIDHDERKYGKTTYNLKKLLNLSLDVMLAFSDKPLRLTVKLGAFISLASFVFAVFLIGRFFLGDIKVSGWTSLIISIWFLFGIVILILGMVGLYIGKIFEKVKNRPTYIVSEYLNFEDASNGKV
jgi:glycosyltransferase involved in cell wall biosynthesis